MRNCPLGKLKYQRYVSHAGNFEFFVGFVGHIKWDVRRSRDFATDNSVNVESGVLGGLSKNRQ